MMLEPVIRTDTVTGVVMLLARGMCLVLGVPFVDLSGVFGITNRGWH